MKLNLGCGQDMRSGYINVDTMPAGQLSQEMYRTGDIAHLDWLTEDNTVEEIVAIDCLEYLSMAMINGTLENWCQKLCVGGVLKILVPDCHAVAQSFCNGQLNLYEYARITLGTRECGGDNRLSLIDCQTLSSMLEQYGLTISVKRYEGIAIYLEAVK